MVYIQGIVVDETEIKLGLFGDDLPAFLTINKSLKVFLDLAGNFRKWSGLIIIIYYNLDKSEMMLLGNAISSLPNQTFFKGIKVKKYLKTLGVYFTCDD